MARRLEATLTTIGQLERFRGHFFNWYDTESLQPLEPRYVSTVDSGNLAAHLITLRHACLERPGRAGSDERALEGLGDVLELLRESRRSLLGGLSRSHVVTFSPAPASPRGGPGRCSRRCPRSPEPMGRAAGGRFGTPRRCSTLVWFSNRMETALLKRPAALQWATALRETRCQPSAPHREATKRRGRSHRSLRPAPWLRLRSTVRASDRWTKWTSRSSWTGVGSSSRSAIQLFRRQRWTQGTTISSPRRCAWRASSRSRAGDPARRAPVPPRPPLTPVGRGFGADVLVRVHVRVPHAPSRARGAVPAACSIRPTASPCGARSDTAEEHGVPWGISEAAYNAWDVNFTYQYSTFGVGGLGLKRGLSEDLVGAPYATALAAMVEAGRGASRISSA